MRNEFVDGRVNTASDGIYLRLQKGNYAICRIVPFTLLSRYRDRNSIIVTTIDDMQLQLNHYTRSTL